MRSPSNDITQIAVALAEGLRTGIHAPGSLFPSRTPEEQAHYVAQYPPFKITDANAHAIIMMLKRYGYQVQVLHRRDFDGETYYDVRITASDGRYDSEDANSIGDALHYAFASFCNDFDGALRREIVALTT